MPTDDVSTDGNMSLDKNDKPSSLGLFGKFLVFVVFLAVVLTALQATGNLPAYPEVESVETVEGAETVSNVDYGYGLTVDLTTAPSELGISELYLFHGDEELDHKSVGPMTKQVEFDMSSPDEPVTLTILAVDGSNRVVSKTEVNFKMVEAGDLRDD